MAQRQNEIIKEIVKEAIDAVGKMSKLDAPENAIAKHVEMSKTINARFAEGLEEISKQALTLKQKK